MSYDLFLTPTRDASKEAILSYFRARPFYEVEGEEIRYEHPDTGVHFSWRLQSEEGEGMVAFNLNYYRPHIYGLEAEIEVSDFVDHFEATLVDPQREGMGEGPYSSVGFLRGWNLGNLTAYRVFLEMEEAKIPLVWPRFRFEKVWRWNYNRGRYSDRLGSLEMKPHFVPTIFFFQEVGGAILSGVVWGDANPIALPKVDLVIAMCHGEALFVRHKDLKPLLAPFEEVSAETPFGDDPRDFLGLPHHLINADDPDALIESLRGLARPIAMTRVKGYQLLTREVVESAFA